MRRVLAEAERLHEADAGHRGDHASLETAVGIEQPLLHLPRVVPVQGRLGGFPGEHRAHAGHGPGAGGIHADRARVGVGAAEDILVVHMGCPGYQGGQSELRNTG